jgi:superfamily II DNA/RNA helicase
LDEADRLLESKQLPIMKNIISQMPEIKQVLLATATID